MREYLNMNKITLIKMLLASNEENKKLHDKLDSLREKAREREAKAEARNEELLRANHRQMEYQVKLMDQMSTNIKFSVTVPAYKAQFLAECIDSILAQTYKNFELIIVNDASPQDLDSIVSKYDDQRIRYYKNKVGFGAEHVVGNWNKCLEYATGDYVIVLFSSLTPAHKNINFAASTLKQKSYAERKSQLSGSLRSVSAVQ